MRLRRRKAVKNDWPQDQGPFIGIGPECFADAEKTVICWQGQEYIKTCGEFVTDLPGGGQAFCTLTYDHPGEKHVNTHLEDLVR